MQLSKEARELIEAKYNEEDIETRRSINRYRDEVARNPGTIRDGYDVGYLKKQVVFKTNYIVIKRVEFYIEAFRNCQLVMNDLDVEEIYSDIKSVIKTKYELVKSLIDPFMLKDHREEIRKKGLISELEQEQEMLLVKVESKLTTAKLEMKSEYKNKTSNSENRILLNNDVGRLRQQLNNFQKSIIEIIFESMLIDNEKKIGERTLCYKLEVDDSEVVKRGLQELGGKVVIIGRDSSAKKIYGLCLIGLLLTSRGEEFERLLISYLGFVKKQLVLDPERNTVSLKDAVEELGLTDEEYKLLGICLYVPHNPFGYLAGIHSPNVSVPSTAIKLSVTKSVENYFYTLLSDSIDKNVPLESDQQTFYFNKKYYAEERDRVEVKTNKKSSKSLRNVETLFELLNEKKGFNKLEFIEFFQNKLNCEIVELNISHNFVSAKMSKLDVAQFLKLIKSGFFIGELQTYNIKRIQEVLDENQECIYQYIPKIEFNNLPLITGVSVNKIQEVSSKIDILLLTVNEWERKALLSEMTPLVGEEAILQGAISSITYRIGQFGNYCAAYTESTMGSLGRQGATLTAERAMRELKPKAVFLLGIAFGIDRRKQRLGDVLIAESIFPYDHEKLNRSFSIKRGHAVQCGNIISERFRTRRIDWECYCGSRKVNVEQGLVLSGEKVVNNKKFRDKLVKEFPTAIGGEMEGAGAYAAVSSPIEVILIKSICDWADGTKDDDAQPFAAFTAVSLAKHVLSKPDVLYPLVVKQEVSRMDVKEKKVEELQKVVLNTNLREKNERKSKEKEVEEIVITVLEASLKFYEDYEKKSTFNCDFELRMYVEKFVDNADNGVVLLKHKATASFEIPNLVKQTLFDEVEFFFYEDSPIQGNSDEVRVSENGRLKIKGRVNVDIKELDIVGVFKERMANAIVYLDYVLGNQDSANAEAWVNISFGFAGKLGSKVLRVGMKEK